MVQNRKQKKSVKLGRIPSVGMYFFFLDSCMYHSIPNNHLKKIYCIVQKRFVRACRPKSQGNSIPGWHWTVVALSFYYFSSCSNRLFVMLLLFFWANKRHSIHSTDFLINTYLNSKIWTLYILWLIARPKRISRVYTKSLKKTDRSLSAAGSKKDCEYV